MVQTDRHHGSFNECSHPDCVNDRDDDFAAGLAAIIHDTEAGRIPDYWSNTDDHRSAVITDIHDDGTIDVKPLDHHDDFNRAARRNLQRSESWRRYARAGAAGLHWLIQVALWLAISCAFWLILSIIYEANS